MIADLSSNSGVVEEIRSLDAAPRRFLDNHITQNGRLNYHLISKSPSTN